MKPLSLVPALPLAAGIGCGIAAWCYGAEWPLAAAICVAAIAALLLKRYYIGFAFIAAAIGWLAAFWHAPAPAPQGIFDGEERTFCGTVVQIKNTPSSLAMVVSIDSIGRDGHLSHIGEPFRIRAFSLPEWMPPQAGDRVRFCGVVEPEAPYGRFPYQRDYSSRDLLDGVVGQLYITADTFKKTADGTGFRAWMESRRLRIVSLLAHSSLDDRAYGLMCALITGYGDDLDPDLKDNFRATGLAHALALSGFHVGIIVMLVSLAMFPLRYFYRFRPYRLVLALALIWFYAIMVGLGESVVRAALMFSVYIVCQVVGRVLNSYNALCVAVALILAASPFSLFSAGLQMSVCAVLGILVFSLKLNPFPKENYKAFMAMNYLSVPVSAMIGTLPLILLYYHRFPLLFLASNILVTLTLPLLMTCGIILLAATAFGWQWAWLGGMVNFMVRFISDFVDTLAHLPFSQISVYIGNMQMLFLVLGISAAGFMLHVKGAKLRLTLSATAFAAFTAIAFASGDIPVNEQFIIPMRGNTSIITKQGNVAYATITCHRREVGAVKDRIAAELEDYLVARGIDTLIMRSCDKVMVINGRRIAMHISGTKPDSLAEKTPYAMICSRFHGDINEAARLSGADTIILSHDLSLSRALRYRRESAYPVIDLRDARFVK